MGSSPTSFVSIAEMIGLAIAAPITLTHRAVKEGLKATDPLGTGRAKEQAKQLADDRKREQQSLQADLAARQNRETGQESIAAADAARRNARKRQLSLATSGQSRQDTILTQGLGGTGAPTPSAKTLLGS
jgi:type II secretory pathway component HofQ